MRVRDLLQAIGLDADAPAPDYDREIIVYDVFEGVHQIESVYLDNKDNSLSIQLVPKIYET